MAFKGTRRRSAREIAETIENVGGDLNAETGVERTSYFARVLESDADLALDVIGDLLTDSVFDPEELEREKNVIVQEIGAVEDTPDDLVFDLLTATAWPDQPIGRPILGTREGVGAFDRAAIDRYLGRRYSAGATVVAAAGAVEHDQIVDLAQSRLGALSAARRAGRSARRLSRRRDQGQAAPRADACRGGLRGPARRARRITTPPRSSPPRPAGACRRGSFRRCARNGASPIRSMDSTGTSSTRACSASTPARPTGTWRRWSPPRSTASREAAHGLEEAEIRRAKAQMKVSLVTALEQPGARVHQLSRQMQIYGRPLSFDEMLARVDAVTVEEVRKTGAAMLRSPPAVAVIGAVGKVPGQAKIAARFERGMMALFGLTRPVSPEPLLRGDGLYLRPAALADYSSWSRLRAASRSFLEPWEPTWPDDDLTRAAFRRRLKRQDDDMARDEAYSFLIFDSVTDELLGGITLGGVRRGVSQSGTLGYWMGAPHAGKGRMTRAVAATVEFALAKLRLHRIEAACIPENAPSIALLERNGFRREGYARGFLRINGAWRDHVLFGLVQGDARPRLAWTNLD